MLAVVAPACRGAHRPDRQRRRFLLVLAGLVSCGAAPRATAGNLLPWSGEGPPPLVLDRLDGPAIDLAEFRGRPVIVHFFATWCAPCIEEIAALDALATRLGAGVTILAVDVGEVDARVRNFFRQRPMRFPILLDRDRAAMSAGGWTGCRRASCSIAICAPYRSRSSRSTGPARRCRRHWKPSPEQAR